MIQKGNGWWYNAEDVPDGVRRVYGEMHSRQWWSRMQKQLPNGGTLIPLIFAYDKTQLTNFSGDKAAWPVYMTIGNIDKDSQWEASKWA